MVREGEPIAWLDATREADTVGESDAVTLDIGAVRPDLKALLDRRAATEDDARPERVSRRHQRGGRTARENIADLCDPGSFVEYGRLAVAAQRVLAAVRRPFSAT